ncbi:MAG: hypothetical protein ACE5FY_08185 [Nitrospiria bacterium]
MLQMAITTLIGISLIVTIIRVILAISSGNLRQLMRSGPEEDFSMFDPMDLKNHGLSPGDVGYHYYDDD